VQRGTPSFTEPHFPIGVRNQVYEMREFHLVISACILYVHISRAVVEQSDVKMSRALRRRRHFRKCRHPIIEVLTVTPPADEIFTKA